MPTELFRNTNNINFYKTETQDFSFFKLEVDEIINLICTVSSSATNHAAAIDETRVQTPPLGWIREDCAPLESETGLFIL